MSEANLQEFADAANKSTVAEPVAKSASLPNSNSNSEAMPTLDDKGSGLSKSQIVQFVTDYVAGLDKGTAVDFYNKLKAEYEAKDATNGGGRGTAKGAGNADSIKTVAKEDLELVIGSDESLSEEFKTKVATIFEAALATAISAEVARLEEETEAKLEEAVAAVTEELTEKVEGRFEHLKAGWLEENKLAVEAALRVEAVDSFMSGLKTLFAEHYVSVPEDKVDVVESLSTQVEDLEARINEEVETAVALRKELNALKAEKILESKLEGLTDTQKDKVRKLAETVDVDDAYATKVTSLVEAVTNKTETKTLVEDSTIDPVEPAEKVAPTVTDPIMAAYAASLARTVKK